MAESNPDRGIIFDFFDAVDSGGHSRHGAVPTRPEPVQETPMRPRKSLETQNPNSMRSHRIALCSCEGRPIVPPICLLALSSQDELKNRLQRQLETPTQQCDEYMKRTAEAEARVKLFERKVLLMKAQVNALKRGHISSDSVCKQLQEMRAELRNVTTVDQQLHIPSAPHQMSSPMTESEDLYASGGHIDNYCSYCGQPLTAIGIGLRDAMRSRQELKSSFQRQLATVIWQRDEYKRGAREAEAKVKLWKRRHIVMKAQVRAARQVFLTDMAPGSHRDTEPKIV
ncbi:hypothetical protein DPEC_G00321330 [Dallia pectoralis]|uniref:Uncharacterized protein n=1 Tax=Dallia pectoralis TaxID=75939 RepID=A0ACC2FA64_DALPE|nr:hypothetical protein DPEC_G00321330 [Dallia pectoralis]